MGAYRYGCQPPERVAEPRSTLTHRRRSGMGATTCEQRRSGTGRTERSAAGVLLEPRAGGNALVRKLPTHRLEEKSHLWVVLALGVQPLNHVVVPRELVEGSIAKQPKLLVLLWASFE